MKTPRWLTTTQAAAIIGGVSSEYVRQEILRGRLVARVLLSASGRHIYRISETELRRYLQRYGR